MKAAISRRYGPPDVVRIEQVRTPDPGDGEILIEVRATTVSSGDWRVRSLAMPPGFGWLARPVLGLRGPRQPVLGTELAGIVAAVGPGVTRFALGEAVFAFPGGAMGAHAEYVAMAEGGLVERLPAGFSFEEGAAIAFGGTTALDYLRRRAGLIAGETVLVTGASGCVGSAAVQLATFFGGRVTAVTRASGVERVRALGALDVIDRERLDVRRCGRTYDIVMDTVGCIGLSAGLPLLEPGGRLLLVTATLPELLRATWPRRGRRRVLAGPARERVGDLRDLRAIAEAGGFRPLIDRVHRFDDIVRAHAHVESGRKWGSVVLTMEA